MPLAFVYCSLAGPCDVVGESSDRDLSEKYQTSPKTTTKTIATQMIKLFLFVFIPFNYSKTLIRVGVIVSANFMFSPDSTTIEAPALISSAFMGTSS